MADPRAVTEALARRGLARGPIISPQTNVNISTPRQLPNSLAGVELSDARDRLLSAMAPVEQKYGSGWGAALAGALKGVGKYMERQGAEKNWELAKDEYLQEERSRAQESARAEEQKRVQELADKIRLEQEKAKLRVQYPSSPTTTVNVGDSGPQMGTIPQGWQVVKDGDAYRMEPVPGGPAAKELEDAKNKDLMRDVTRDRAGNTVIQDIGRAMELVPDLVGSDEDGVATSTARIAKSKLPGTPEYVLTQFKESALSNVGLDTLQQMRENSPTGGALGQVPIQQQKRLEQVLGSLEIGQPVPVLDDNLKRIQNIYIDIVYGSAEERRAAVAKGAMSQEESDQIDGFYNELSFDEFGRSKDAAPTVSTQKEFDALPSGAVYIDAQDGRKYKKP